ncbi:MAG: PAS domain-containing sensor histidine kinase [Sphingobacteriales bacterium]|nr:MAG: PAS domain-containing sensor histidine kinase [Sphingobacteriales bacterium]
MRLKILDLIPLSKLLFASYCGLLIFIGLVRFWEYNQTREAAGKVNTISNISNRKLQLLLSIIQNYNRNEKLVFETIHINDNNYNSSKAAGTIPAIYDNKDNFIAYKKLIETGFERTSFNKLLAYDSITRQVNDSIIRFAAGGNVQNEKLQQLIRQKANIHADFDASSHQLLEMVSSVSATKISEINDYLQKLARRKELSSYVVIFLLLVLGLSIGNTLRKLKRTENKYRLLFELSPLPNFIVDSKTFRYLKVNDAAVKLYGYNRKEFLNIRAFELRGITNKEQQEKLKAEWKHLIEAGNQYTIKARHYKKNGEILDVEVNAKAIFLDRKVFFLTINDITEKEKLDKKITKAIIKTQEDERQKLGAELHDNIGQLLVSTQLFLSMSIKADHNEKEKYLAETRKYLEMAVAETRNISHRIYPGFLDELSLPEAISNLLYEINPDGSMQVSFEYDSCLLTEFISPDVKLNIYRISQEQLKNIQKYSKAGEVGIELRIMNNLIHLKITDNGIGFDVNKIKPGIGLLHMKKRAELFSGRLLIDAAPNKGCSITVEIPLSIHKVA